VFTLKLFLVFHVVLPLVLGVGIVLHLVVIHLFGSSYIKIGGTNKVIFYNKFVFKDLVVLVFWLWLFFINSYGFMEEDNFMLVDLISSPLHIKPE
jgi:quinol-cytochrome oxidoreductase complex cytochrome b subunit